DPRYLLLEKPLRLDLELGDANERLLAILRQERVRIEDRGNHVAHGERGPTLARNGAGFAQRQKGRLAQIGGRKHAAVHRQLTDTGAARRQRGAIPGRAHPSPRLWVRPGVIFRGASTARPIAPRPKRSVMASSVEPSRSRADGNSSSCRPLPFSSLDTDTPSKRTGSPSAASSHSATATSRMRWPSFV